MFKHVLDALVALAFWRWRWAIVHRPDGRELYGLIRDADKPVFHVRAFDAKTERLDEHLFVRRPGFHVQYLEQPEVREAFVRAYARQKAPCETWDPSPVCSLLCRRCAGSASEHEAERARIDRSEKAYRAVLTTLAVVDAKVCDEEGEPWVGDGEIGYVSVYVGEAWRELTREEWERVRAEGVPLAAYRSKEEET